MNYKDLEKNIRHQLQSHEVKIDTDQLVADIFGNKKKKKPFPMWILALVFAAAAFAGVYLIYVNKDKIKPHKIKATPESEMPARTDGVHALLSNENSMENIPSNKIQNNTNNLRSEDSKDASSQTDVNRSLKIKTNNKGRGPQYFLSSDLQADSHNSVNSQIVKTNVISYISNLSTSNLTNEKTDQTYSKEIKLPARNYLAVNSDQNQHEILSPGVKCPSFKRKKQWMISLIPEVGAFYPVTSFQHSGNQHSEVLEIRKQDETTLEGLQAALYGKIYQKAKPWYLKTGLNYGRITRKMTFDGSYTKRDTTIGIISITESQNGDTITVVKGPIVTESVVTKKEIRHYYHHLWSIPLVIGYQKRNERFEWGAELGVNINLLSNQSGYVMTSANDFGLVKNAGLYKQRLGISYLAQIHAGIPVNENNIFAVALRANFNPNNFANSASSLSEKYQMVGAHIMYELRF